MLKYLDGLEQDRADVLFAFSNEAAFAGRKRVAGVHQSMCSAAAGTLTQECLRAS